MHSEAMKFIKAHVSERDDINSWHTGSCSAEASLHFIIYCSSFSSPFAQLRIPSDKILRDAWIEQINENFTSVYCVQQSPS